MAALYRAADIMVVTPLRDGMNLVAKEYVACRYDGEGALVLSEFAGAADELRQAFLVNPYDINGMKASILEAINADPKSLNKRMKAMRKTINEHDGPTPRASSTCSRRPSPCTASSSVPPVVPEQPPRQHPADARHLTRAGCRPAPRSVAILTSWI
jgi:hypothetical protein